MNYGSLVNVNFLQKIATFFDIIPKIVYFLFAAFASGIDAMQALVRKLAGLDTYYQTSTGEIMTQKDPLTEFIYGILGIGDSASVYKGLNTVFWSLAIFGLIVLVVSTIVAIVKSHYNEDSEGTSPSKYIYTAIKSILTFAVMPVVVVIGMQLSTFVLRTLDNITAGTTNESAIKGIYGTQATEIFRGETLRGTDNKVYAHYDYFGVGDPTSTATFGGLMFKASAYGANRARSGQTSVSSYQNITVNGKQIFGDASNCPEYGSLQTNQEKREYVGMQIDYAFQNNLQLNTGLSYSATISAVESTVPYLGISDVTGGFGAKSTINSFSKYDVSAVWLFYDLWQFNFIVAFGGGVTVFGIMISIIVGMMTRLIKGAAMFLIYPSLLGIAPLDNFKAFKGWGTTFMQQIMMAFGAIVGINILMLILPYLQSISFFNNGLLDAIVNTIILIAGLMMTKDFISMVAGFVGGADAAGSGDGLKGSIAGGFKRGFGIAGKAGAAVAKTGYHAGKAVAKTAWSITGKPIGAAIKKGKASAAAKRVNEKNQAGTKTAKNFDKTTNAYEGFIRAQEDAAKKMADLQASVKGKTADAKLKKAGDDAYNSVIKKGGSVADAEKARDAVLLKGLLKQSGKLKEYEKAEKAEKNAKTSASKKSKELEAYDETKMVEKYKLAKGADGKMVSTTGFWKSWGDGLANTFAGKKGEDGKRKGGVLGNLGDAGKSIADGFIKAIKNDLAEGIGIDKLIGGGIKMGKEMWQTKGVQGKMFGEGKSKKEGDALQKEIAQQQGQKMDAQQATLNAMAKSMGDFVKASEAQTKSLGKIFSAISAQNNNPPPTNNGGNGGTGGNAT